MNTVKRLVLAAVVVAVALPAAAFAYFNFIQDPAPKRLTLDSGTTSTTAGSAGTASASGDLSGTDLSGTWRPTSASQVGYRVNEVAFGQRKAAVGRTNKVTGTMNVSGTTVSAVDLTVDMTSVSSDESRRDNQFQGRIMNTSRFPTATFKLTSPVALSSTSGPVTVKATGDLTVRGTTRPVTVELKAQRQGAGIAVNGSIPVVFGEWGIPNPSFGPVSTEDHGELELLVVFAKA
ncbi:MAG TPA: YceI family protein [Acidimicrobiales bacterium]|jgi:polyisoprenoid-binding protein YceI|nr:YceI family protein [Acidimicrobiales bacterium]